MRASLSNASDELMKKYMNVNGQPSSGNAKEDSKNLSQAYKDIQQDLSSAKVFEVPKDWWKIWELGWNTLFRILATAGFLSLGAPFWYNTLKGLANLRSQVAQKQDSEAVQA
jgi:hypothetical protein